MTNRLAAILVVLIGLAFGADLYLNNGQGGLFLFRKFVDFVEYIAFWR